MSSIVHRFVQHIEAQQLNVLSVRVLQHGETRGMWDRTEDKRRLQHSISKSFTCMAVGLALEEGIFTLESKLGEYFTWPTPAPALTAFSPADLTLYDLLRMSSGHDVPVLWAEERATLAEKDWAKYYMSLPIDRVPGEAFTYSSADTFMISAMFQAASGQTVKDYLIPRLFDPLEIYNVEWETSPLGITLGCAGLQLTNEELGRFGQFLLQKGNWNGSQLVPAEWIDQATTRQITTPGEGDWGQGYGYQFWLCSHNAYRADGAYGQLCVVLPELDAVVAVSSDELNMQGILDLIWSDILPHLESNHQANP
ncbi:serine hydrolase domain-containing protein [Paenibacillus illinoisensis]|uniref:serine hydrolase domain-containing protein n=1 Tax=Paenibacillus illinoisensis TaxID=59845 RepID=UPI0020418EC9|nr:serine hydrolase [Paenibacillus illinoisensis]MCM3205504.1 beta-lactamase family protein [Paenibacillus illinoisensis]